MSSSPIRVAMVAACPFPARRGTPLRVERLAEALLERGHEVELFTYDLAEEVASHDFKIHRPSSRPRLSHLQPGPTISKLVWHDPALAWMLRRALLSETFDVIHAHHVEGVLAAAWARRSRAVPLIYDAHTMLSSELPSYRIGLPDRVKRSVGTWLDHRIPAMADHVVTVTPDIRDRLIVEFDQDPARVSVAMNGVEAELFASADPDGAIPDRVIYCGTLAPYQGIELMLQAFAVAHARRPSLQLVCVVGASFEPYESLANRLGIRHAITLEKDALASLAGHLERASVAVLPRPVCDGIPQKLLNYMAAARPVVAFRGSAKVLEHERTGLVIDNGDIDGFANAILSLVEAPARAREMGIAARSYVLNECSWDGVARKCESVYRGLIAERNAPVVRAPA